MSFKLLRKLERERTLLGYMKPQNGSKEGKKVERKEAQRKEGKERGKKERGRKDMFLDKLRHKNS